ncbi:immunoglobulin superfamily member 1-like [Varanus komodoensis]|uniref:immunoglobulin superfamily member 1-like n=1 Tax=Varanus komodoensis TaxID=61221 RepID=UPI001CF7E543|nr:immunoglobulin superfamily member 1-like [Varanus komodoensis]
MRLSFIITLLGFPSHANIEKHVTHIVCEGEDGVWAEFQYSRKGTRPELDTEIYPVFPYGKALFFSLQGSNGGVYHCTYCAKEGYGTRCSHPDNTLHSNIPATRVTTPLSPRCSLFPLDPTLSRPSIRIRPKPQISLGLNATIECQGPEYYFHLTFFLFKSGNLIASQKEEPMKNTTQFLLSSVRLEDAGSYSCRYQRIVPFAQSEPSDAVELTVTDNSSQVLWTGIGAGLLVLALVLVVLFLAFLWCRRRRKGPAGSKQPEPVKNARSSTSLNLDTGEDPMICYAVLNHHSVKSEQEAGTVHDLDTCTYASVARENSL